MPEQMYCCCLTLAFATDISSSYSLCKLPLWTWCLHVHYHRCCHHGGDGNRNDIDHCHHVAGHHRAGPSNEFEWCLSGVGMIL